MGSRSRFAEDLLESIDGEELADALCRELRLDCAEPLTTPGEIVTQRPKALGSPAATPVAEMRRDRAERL